MVTRDEMNRIDCIIQEYRQGSLTDDQAVERLEEIRRASEEPLGVTGYFLRRGNYPDVE
ncbi:hypothetical protein [Streptomyces sp. NPDC001404]|uniref:hypothetical protein n=1 Tax=Streptomyces sp. NPDC001404 TaxID=3364571 RepID=UPI0036B82C5D